MSTSRETRRLHKAVLNHTLSTILRINQTRRTRHRNRIQRVTQNPASYGPAPGSNEVATVTNMEASRRERFQDRLSRERRTGILVVKRGVIDGRGLRSLDRLRPLIGTVGSLVIVFLCGEGRRASALSPTLVLGSSLFVALVAARGGITAINLASVTPPTSLGGGGAAFLSSRLVCGACTVNIVN